MKAFNKIWVDSRVEGVGRSWYHGGCDEMTLEQLEALLKDKKAIVFYKGEFYSSIYDAPLATEYRSLNTYGMPTGQYIAETPTVTVVPEGTTLYHSYYSDQFVFPNNN